MCAFGFSADVGSRPRVQSVDKMPLLVLLNGLSCTSSHICRALEEGLVEEEEVASLTMFRAALQMEGGMREGVVAGLGSRREEGLEDEGEAVGLEKVRTLLSVVTQHVV